ncbi:MAG: chlorite dismutase family protein [Elusimicrobiota bacterium]
MNLNEGKVNIYSSFLFLRLKSEFRLLVSNEKIAAKQEFENLVGNCQEKIFLRTYFLTGLKKSCDILFWRMSEDLQFLQEICSRTFSSGIGKYFEQTDSYIGMYKAPSETKDLFSFMQNNFGIYKYLLIHPLIKSQIWYEMTHEEREALISERGKVLSSFGDIKENFFYSYGIDDQDMVVTRESKDLEKLVEATKELKKQRIKNYTLSDRPVYLAIGRDLRDILDGLS